MDYILNLLQGLLLPAVVPAISHTVATYLPYAIGGLFGLFVALTLVRLTAKLL